MRLASTVLALGLIIAVPAFAQDIAPAPAPEAAINPYRQLFTRWDGANRESLDFETRLTRPDPDPQSNAVPAYSPLQSRSQAEAIALGEWVGRVVRAGDCAEGERIAREAGDFALVRAVREHCRAR